METVDIKLEQFLFVKTSEAIERNLEVRDYLIRNISIAELRIVENELASFESGDKLRLLASLQRA